MSEAQAELIEDRPWSRAERHRVRGNMVTFLEIFPGQPGGKGNQLKSLIMAQIERWRHG
jgi:hypothetical protein